MNDLISKLGDWNPQFFREIKGRLKGFNIAIAIAVSLFGQLTLFLYQLREIPTEFYSTEGEYCFLRPEVLEKRQLFNRQIENLYQQISQHSKIHPSGKSKITELQLQIDQLQQKVSELSNQYCPIEQLNMPMWWRDHWQYIFSTLTVVFIFALLVAGTYLLIDNLATEERRGTLNFIRLSPQPATSVLIGKMLGVPILVYLVILSALPFHFIAGRSANIATSHILIFWIVAIACCIFFYSAALLFGLYFRWFSGFQPWLGSGAVLLFLIITMQSLWSSPYVTSAGIWIKFFSPFDITAYLFPNFILYRYKWEMLQEVQFFYLPIGKNLLGLVSLHLLNYGLGTYCLWQGLTRCFRNSNTSLFSKGQSYFLVACTQVLLWGFTLQYTKNYSHYCPPKGACVSFYDVNYQMTQNFGLILVLNLILFFGFLAILSPHRQTVQDWARYRHQNVSGEQSVRNNFWLTDLIWGEKSPILVAALICLAIASTPVVIWLFLVPILNTPQTSNLNLWINQVNRLNLILGVAMFVTLMMICAAIVQRALFMKTKKRFLWAFGFVVALFFLPQFTLTILQITPSIHPTLWLLSTFPWAGLEFSSTPVIFVAWLGELAILGLLIWHLFEEVKILGESATKALLVKD
ncbi:ABC transporter permease [Scytonema sp. UIC 10036]|uniref:ABC transporter permease n=1 Tax=Scytonema sp. UIC 10036 TaxID=2304196 RepID=UPI0012DA5EDC|nr:ABC transporter permease [Scytonema sp. UIC 10036]MUG95331.1 ABC transporter permease [Scytonema sp. UIC 10036]